jgi:lysophospholipase L1-like esterase
VVFYDENANGRLDPQEVVRLPNANVRAGSGNARTALGGRAVIAAPRGLQSVSVDPASLPPYYSTATLTVNVPVSGDVLVPATLPLLPGNRRNTYLGFGDSLTERSGYLVQLEAQLRGYFGTAFAVNEGFSGTRTDHGAKRIHGVLADHRPAYTLILYGTNDWNETYCRVRFPCHTIDSLRRMVQEARGAGSLPFLATLPPVNTRIGIALAPARNDWIAHMNELIRGLAREEQAVLVDVHQAFLAQPDPSALFEDYVHPNAFGRDVITRTFFEAITTRRP